MKSSIFKPGKKYTFSDYFDFNYPTEQIVDEFGYTFALLALTLPELTNYNPAAISTSYNLFYRRYLCNHNI